MIPQGALPPPPVLRSAQTPAGQEMQEIRVQFLEEGTATHFGILAGKIPWTEDQENVASVFYTTVIPMLNPLIYSLRNKDSSVQFTSVAQSCLTLCNPMDAASPSQGRWDPDSLRPALSLGGQATAWECSPVRSLCLTKSSACGLKGFPDSSLVKNPPAMQETLVQFLSWEDCLEKG